MSLVGILLLLAGMIRTVQMFREEYLGPAPAALQGFAPMVSLLNQTAAAPALGAAALPGMRPADLSASLTERLQSAQQAATAQSGLPLDASGGGLDRSSPDANATPAPNEASLDHSAPVLAAAAADAAMPVFATAPTATAQPAIPDWLDIPIINLSAPIVPVPPAGVSISGQSLLQWTAPDEPAAGWHDSSALLGQPGNTVLNGHHNIFGSIFAQLHTLQPGDQIYVWSHGVVYFYEVDQVMILKERDATLAEREQNARWIMPSQDERLTLVTCWPPTSNTHRVVVAARRIP